MHARKDSKNLKREAKMRKKEDGKIHNERLISEAICPNNPTRTPRELCAPFGQSHSGHDDSVS